MIYVTDLDKTFLRSDLSVSEFSKKVWNEFKEGHYVGFEYDKKGNSKIIPFNAEQAGMGGSESVEGKNMAKLAAGL